MAPKKKIDFEEFQEQQRLAVERFKQEQEEEDLKYEGFTPLQKKMAILAELEEQQKNPDKKKKVETKLVPPPRKKKPQRKQWDSDTELP